MQEPVLTTATRSSFLSFRRDSTRRKPRINGSKIQTVIPWIASPFDEAYASSPCLRKRSDTSPIELFYDVFLVANLATFTATHEINNIKALWSYVGFLGVIWFTWLQVTLFDIRFSKDSVFERICKAVQLAAMIGFASAGSRFTARVSPENVWAFRSLTMLLAGSRFMLALQYAINIIFMYGKMQFAIRGMWAIVAVLTGTGFSYLVLYSTFGHTDPHVWTVWFGLFLFESLIIMGVSSYTPGIELEDTHLNTRMGLLTLIIIGESVISVTRIVNKVVAGGGWTKWSFIQILGVTSTVYLLWHSYYDISPRYRYGSIRQQIWTHLHFPFHVSIILSSEGCQILALTLDIVLKLKYLTNTICFSCEEPRPMTSVALKLLNSTITDMEIDFSKAQGEKKAIHDIMGILETMNLCASNDSMANSTKYGLTDARSAQLLGNVTASLFSSMGITTPEGDLNNADGKKFLKTYVSFLTFVYVYYFVVASLAMVHFATFALLTRRHHRPVYNAIAAGTRLLCAVFLVSLIAFVQNFDLTYYYMTSPVIIFTFALTLLIVLLVDRLLDWWASRHSDTVIRQSSTRSTAPMVTRDSEADDSSFGHGNEVEGGNQRLRFE